MARAANRTVRIRLYTKRAAHRRVIEWIDGRAERDDGRTMNELLVQALCAHIKRSADAVDPAAPMRAAKGAAVPATAREATTVRTREPSADPVEAPSAPLTRARGILDSL